MAAGADPDLVLREARAVAELYGQAVEELLAIVARRLAAGITVEGWAERKLAELQELSVEVARVVDRLGAEAPEAVREAIAGGWRASGAAENVVNPQVTALMTETVSSVTGAHGQILRSTVDGYRRIVADVAADTVVGSITRRQAAQRALDRFADSGLGGIRDRAGRRWSIESYAEMATRTAVGRAQVAGTLDRFVADGADLVIVSDAPQECSVCRPWEGRVLSISGSTPKGQRLADGVVVAGSVREAQSAGLHHPNCFPAEVSAGGPPPEAGYRRWYEGDLVVIETASGVKLPVTPNHPVLTSTGWVAAGDLEEGQHVVRHLAEVEPAMRGGPHDLQVPAPIGEVVGALREAVEVAPMRVPSAPEQFHGDGTVDGQVEVVAVDGLLENDVVARRCDSCGQRSLLVGGMGLGALLPDGPAGELLVGAGGAANSVVRGADLGGALGGRHAGPLAGLGLPAGDPGASHLDPPADGRLGDAEGGRQLVLALAGAVALDEIVHLGRRQFAGHVHNLQTGEGWYTAGGIVVHNCRHRLGRYVVGLTNRLTDTEDPAGDRARQEQRRLERGVRQWKRRAAAALDDDARRAANARARDWQARLRAHVDAEDLKRQPQRERLGAR